MGIISKARKYLDQKVLETLYYTMIYPYLLYCNILWGNSSYSTLWPVLKLQKMAIRLIVNVPKRVESTQYFKQLNIIKVTDLYDISVAIFLYNFFNLKLPETFNEYFKVAESFHNVNTRQSSKYRIPLYKSKTGSNFVKKTGIEIWNTINDSYGFQYTIDKFKILTIATKLAEY